MTVSVVIPLYNKARHIERAVHSVLQQTYPAIEVIVVDDGSTDGGGEIVRNIVDHHVRVVTTENRGVSAARNLGSKLASTDLVAFLDADDEWLPHFLVTVMDLHKRFPDAGICATAYQICSKNGALISPTFSKVPTYTEGGLIEDYFNAACYCGPLISSSIVLRKTALDKAGGFPEHIRRNEDLDTWMRVALRYAVAWSPRPAVIWHSDAESRATHSIPYGVPPFSDSLHQFEQQNCLPSSSYRIESVKEYIAKNELRFVMYNLLSGHKQLALSLLHACRFTKMFRRNWYALRLIAMLPFPLIVVVWKGYEMKLGRKPVLPTCCNIRRTVP